MRNGCVEGPPLIESPSAPVANVRVGCVVRLPPAPVHRDLLSKRKPNMMCESMLGRPIAHTLLLEVPQPASSGMSSGSTRVRKCSKVVTPWQRRASRTVGESSGKLRLCREGIGLCAVTAIVLELLGCVYPRLQEPFDGYR